MANIHISSPIGNGFSSLRERLGLSEPYELQQERESLENAHLLATYKKQPQTVEVDGAKVLVIDTGSGREVRSR